MQRGDKQSIRARILAEPFRALNPREPTTGMAALHVQLQLRCPVYGRLVTASRPGVALEMAVIPVLNRLLVCDLLILLHITLTSAKSKSITSRRSCCGLA